MDKSIQGTVAPTDKYLLSRLSHNSIAFELNRIREIIITPGVTPLPNQPGHQKGIINLRKNVIPLFDMRKMMGMLTIEDELQQFTDILKQREQDHVRWLDELRASIVEKREFRLTTDPHTCAFGKWYDNFKTDNIRISLFLRAFDEPHKRIHQSAIIIKELIESKGYQAAIEYFGRVKDNELSKMIELFNELYQKIRENSKSYSIIVGDGDELHLKGFVVDEVERITEISQDMIKNGGFSSNGGFLKGIARNNEKDYLIIDYDKLLE